VALLLPVKVFERFTGAPGLVPIKSPVLVAVGRPAPEAAIPETLKRKEEPGVKLVTEAVVLVEFVFEVATSHDAPEFEDFSIW
jgi:hypothetical protein